MALVQRCGASGCPSIQVEPYCPEHTRPVWRRGSKRWERFSRAYRREHPVCEEERCEEPSAHVHHLDGLGPQGRRGFDPENLMALCPRCHALRTRPWEFRPEVAQVPSFEPRAAERTKSGRLIFR
jgi:5-methylcytosine-specific restriction endonuclease McrA